MNKIELIHLQFVNGNRKDAINLIDEYGLYDFFEDYKDYLTELYISDESVLEYFSGITITYFRIKNR